MIQLNEQLKTNADFENAMLFKQRIIVLQYGVTIDYGGVIEQHDDKYVKINNRYYKKSAYEFRVR